MSFFIGSSHQTEVAFKEIVTLESLELTRHFTLECPRNLGRGNLGVVVADSLGQR